MIPSEEDKNIIRIQIGKYVEEGRFFHKKIIIFGCTIYARDIRDSLRGYGIEIDGFLDNNKRKAGRTCLGVPVYLPEDYFQQNIHDVIVIICSKYFREMIKQLNLLGCSDTLMIQVAETHEKEADSLETLEYHLSCVKEGYQIYHQIKENYSKEYWLLLCPYPGTGDIYMACIYLNAYLKKENIKHYVVVVLSRGCRETAALFGIQNIRVVPGYDMELMLRAWEFLGNEHMLIKPLLYWGWRTKRYLYADEYPQITFNEMFLYDVFNLSDDTEKKYPLVDRQSTYAESLFQKRQLKPCKTVIIAPYAGSFASEMDITFWEEIVLELGQKGWTAATNCFGEKEIPVPGTVPICFPYAEATNVLEYAGAFIALRSGLCDIVSQARCKMIVLYESGFNAARYEYFSLKKMGLNSNVMEFVYEKNAEESIKRMIIETFK